MKKPKKRPDVQIKKEHEDAIDGEQTNNTFPFDETAIKKETDEVHNDNDTMIKPDPLGIPDNFSKCFSINVSLRILNAIRSILMCFLCFWNSRDEKCWNHVCHG